MDNLFNTFSFNVWDEKKDAVKKEAKEKKRRKKQIANLKDYLETKTVPKAGEESLVNPVEPEKNLNKKKGKSPKPPKIESDSEEETPPPRQRQQKPVAINQQPRRPQVQYDSSGDEISADALREIAPQAQSGRAPQYASAPNMSRAPAYIPSPMQYAPATPAGYAPTYAPPAAYAPNYAPPPRSQGPTYAGPVSYGYAAPRPMAPQRGNVGFKHNAPPGTLHQKYPNTR